MIEKINLDTMLIWKGLLGCDRETLSIFIALFEDSKGLSLLSDKFLDLKEKVQKSYEKYLSKQGNNNLEKSLREHFSKRIEKTTDDIKKSNASDDNLKTRLWKHLIVSFELNHNDYIVPRDVKRDCDNIANKIINNVSLQQKNEKENVLQRLNPFKKINNSEMNFGEAIEYLITKLTKETTNHDSKVINNIEKNISKLDNKIIEQSGVSNLTEGAIKKTLLTSGSLLGLMSGVESIGFSAYIVTAKASAFIPLVGGKTLVSLLAVLSSPFFVMPAIFITGAISSNSLKKSIQQSFGTIISTILVMRGILKQDKLLETENFLSQYNQRIMAIDKSTMLTSFGNSSIPQMVQLISSGNILNLSKEDHKLLFSIINIEQKDNKQILKIYPPSIKNIDNIAITGLTFADFIYDLVAIDPHVIEATDFSRKADISDVYEFSLFSESLNDIAETSLYGHHANLMGYTAERLVASQLIKDGHIVEIPNSASQPGYDLLVDGNEFQVKCIKPENFNILEKHFDTYPDTPVFVNAEMAQVIADKNPDWSDLVFYIGGYTHEKASGLLTQAIDAGQELNDYEIIPSLAIISTIQNTIQWKRGKQSFQSATFNILLDSLTKGGMAMAGGVAGSSIGMLLFGPAGMYIIGGISTIFGATQGNIITNQIDKFLDPKREADLKKIADELLEICNKELITKIALLEKKISMLSNNGISSFIKYRFMWEILSFQIIIKRHNDLIKNETVNANKKILEAIKLANESTVHSYCLQKSYIKIANFLNQKVDRLSKVSALIKRMT